MIDEQVLTPYKSFTLKAKITLTTGHFSNQLGSGGVLTGMQYKPGTSLFSTNKGMQYEQGTSSVQLRMCSTNKGHHQVLGKWAFIRKLLLN